jgi:hypothetical protein
MVGVFLAPLVFSEYKTTSIMLRAIEFEALAFGISLLATAIYPNFFGVQKGENVLVVTSDPITNRVIIKLATALESRKLHEMIKISVMDGTETVGTVESYPGIISPARISIKPEENIKVI